jgi:hypothetical protein
VQALSAQRDALQSAAGTPGSPSAAALESQREIAQRNRERAQRLFAQQAATAQQLDQAERDDRVLRDQIKAQEEQIEAQGRQVAAQAPWPPRSSSATDRADADRGSRLAARAAGRTASKSRDHQSRVQAPCS